MKSLLLSLSASLLFAGHSMAVTVFMIGVDNGNTNEFEQEGGGRNDNKYYWHVGNYTSVAAIGGGFGENWGGDVLPNNPAGTVTNFERWADAADTSGPNGFARAITSSFTTHNIFFQLAADQVGAGKSLQFAIDFINPGFAAGLTESRHDVTFFLNGVAFHSVTGLSTAQLVTANIDASSLAAGEAVLSWQRTGGASGGNWINIDYVSLVSVPEPSRTVLMLAALGLFIIRRRR